MMSNDMMNVLLIELIQKIYHQGSKDHDNQTNDSKEEYFDMMARRIQNLLGK